MHENTTCTTNFTTSHVSAISYNFSTERFPMTVPLNVTLKFSLRGIKSGAFYF